ncbi:hypothetical protein QT972_10295 [Microcoleus sp. herbarium7]|uniref:hypothetical protein n=1 Tax=Microcoleus sp. herbarium7 TaxID=3055435 RepID=UPI002FD38D10
MLAVMSLAELLPKLQELSRADQLRVIEFLASQLSKQETLSLLEPGRTYEVWSPYDAFEAADVLGRMLEEDKAKQDA